MKAHVVTYALEINKHLLLQVNREFIEIAEKQGKNLEDAVAEVSFSSAEAFEKEATKRGY